MLKHSPDLIHGSKVSTKSVSEFARPSKIFSASVTSISSSSVAFPIHRLNPLSEIDSTSTFFFENDLLRLIPNIKHSNSSRDIRIVVHGSSGGEVHHLLEYVVEAVQYLRGTHVDLEVLTQEKPIDSSSSSIWLVPLLLLPGKHAQNDIPKIFRRLSNQGIATTIIPFLGSWSHWISILRYFVSLESKIKKPILIHHPINSEIGVNYLKNLKKIIRIPIIPWTQWHQFSDRNDNKYTPIPFALAPNKNTIGLRESDSISSLLEIDLFLFSLIKLLTLLS